MRIVLYVSDFPKLSETFIVNQFVGLLDRGHDVHVHCDRCQTGEASKFRQLMARRGWRDRVHVRWPCRPRILAVLLAPAAVLHCFFRNPSATAQRALRAWRQLGVRGWKQLYLDARLISLRPDLVHFEFGSLAAPRMELRDVIGCKFLVSFRGYDVNFVGVDDERYYDAVWRRADALHFLGDDLWRRAQERGCPAEVFHVLIPPAIDTRFFSPARQAPADRVGAADRPLRLLSVGRLEWKKGYEYALEAVKLLKQQGLRCEYRIIGDGQFLGALSFACRQLGLEPEVTFLRNCTSEQVKHEMEWADVLVHGAVSEGFCNAVLEAQAMALPVVCADAGGLAENVADGETGFVVARRNPQAMAERIRMLAEDGALRRRMGTAGRDRVKSRFQLTEQVKLFENAYQRIVGAENPRPAIRPGSGSRNGRTIPRRRGPGAMTVTKEQIKGYAWGWLKMAAASRGARVLNYHGVVETFRDRTLERNFHSLAAFRAHVAFLRKRRVLSLSELAEILSAPGARVDDAAVITFDDGYRNNLLAAELLREAGLPWTIFVTTGAAGRGGSIWPVELSLLLLQGSARHVEALGRRWPLEDRPSREAAFQAIRMALKSMPADARRAACQDIQAQFPRGECERLLSEVPSLAMMTWKEIQGLDGVEIGSHGVDHEIHHTAQDPAVRSHELRESKRVLEEMLQRPCRFFAFPNGDTMPASAEELRAAGYQLGFSTEQGCISEANGKRIYPRVSCAARLDRFFRRYYWGV